MNRNNCANINQLDFKKFFDDFYPILVVFANKFLNDQNKAEDVVQESFIYLYENKMNLNDIDRIKSYLYATARNKCLNILRHNNIRKEYRDSVVEESELFYQEKLIENETYSLLLKAINKLPEQTANVVNLMLRGYKNIEIAEELDISVNTVRNLKQMAIKKLRLSLKEYMFLFVLMNEGIK